MYIVVLLCSSSNRIGHNHHLSCRLQKSNAPVILTFGFTMMAATRKKGKTTSKGKYRSQYVSWSNIPFFFLNIVRFFKLTCICFVIFSMTCSFSSFNSLWHVLRAPWFHYRCLLQTLMRQKMKPLIHQELYLTT